MKKNYIAPSTEAATWASMGLMQSIAFATGSASSGEPTFNKGEEIV
jgi:hypothetical protein